VGAESAESMGADIDGSASYPPHGIVSLRLTQISSKFPQIIVSNIVLKVVRF
jgi:hypothetical protein